MQQSSRILPIVSISEHVAYRRTLVAASYGQNQNLSMTRLARRTVIQPTVWINRVNLTGSWTRELTACPRTPSLRVGCSPAWRRFTLKDAKESTKLIPG